MRETEIDREFHRKITSTSAQSEIFKLGLKRLYRIVVNRSITPKRSNNRCVINLSK